MAGTSLFSKTFAALRLAVAPNAAKRKIRNYDRAAAYASLVNGRLFLPLTQVDELASDIPIDLLPQHEIYKNNCFYGLARLLKRYAGLPDCYALKLVISHISYGSLWEKDYRSPLPMCLVWGEETREALAKVTDKPVVAIGPPVHYAPNIYGDKEIRSEKARLGKNALLFHMHSTHYIETTYDPELFLQKARELNTRFDSVRFCIYWKDYLSGSARPFLQSGFECVTAGHMFDPLFYSRLKALFSVADYSFSNNMGTHAGLSVGLGIPHAIFPQASTWNSPPLADVRWISTYSPDEILQAFSCEEGTITPQQRDIANRLFGFDTVKNAEEIRNILARAEELYQISREKRALGG